MVKPIEEKIKTRTRKIPAKYIREVINGKPYYYKGYKSVINGTKQIEEIMGSSSLQSFLVGFIYGILFSKINRKKYSLTTNEAGLHLGLKNNISTDIGIFWKEKLNEDLLNKIENEMILCKNLSSYMFIMYIFIGKAIK